MRLDRSSASLSRRERRIGWFSAIVLVLLVLPSAEGAKSYLIHSGYVAQQTGALPKLLELSGSIAGAPANFLAADRSLPVLRLDVKYEDWLLLEADRKKALRAGIIADERHEVGAVLTHGGDAYKAKVRLQGDLLDHVNRTTRWSLRFELKDKKAIFSARRFALLSSHVRVHQGSLLFQKTLELAGFDIISPQHKPVRVVVNGADWGVMLFAESFAQSLLAVNQRTEGLITRLDLYEQRTDGDNIVRVLKPRVIQKNTVLGDSSLGKQRKIALQLLVDFLAGDRAASDVFDAEKLGQYLAAVDIWGAWHAITWNNWRWYYNPHSARLEPIQSDVGVTPGRHRWLLRTPSNSLGISKRMLQDPLVAQHYATALLRLESIAKSGELIPQLKKHEAEFLSKLHGSAPLTAAFNLELLGEQMDCVISGYATPPCNAIPEIGVHLHTNMTAMAAQANWDLESSLKSSGDDVVLNLVNNDRASLRVIGVTGVTRFGEIDPFEDINSQFPQVLPSKSKRRIVLPPSIVAATVRAALDSGKMASYEFVRDVVSSELIPRPERNEDRTAELLRKYPFIAVDGNSWRIPAGNWTIDDYLRTPADWNLAIEAGAKLAFSSSGGLMVFGKLSVDGSEGAPVVFGPQTGVRSWAGIAVFGGLGRQESQISHLHIDSASSPKLGLWQPRGASFFHNTELTVNHLRINNNASEDALNIINSHVDISGLSISNALSDAFDCDFCTGTISDSEFANIGYRSGGDGIDVSGSDLKIDQVRFTGIRDKAISGGERSRLQVTNTRFNDVNFGLVAKDDTTIVASGVRFEEVKHGALMSYSKKPIFGAAKLTINDYSCADLNCEQKFAVDIGSELLVDGVALEARNLDVETLYDTIMKSDKPI